MRALVIGGDGFAGRWLVRHLIEHGDAVHAVVGPRFVPPLESGVDATQADVRDYDSITRAVQLAEAEYVFYLAAVSASDARSDLRAVAEVIVLGAVSSYLAALGARARRFVFVSSSHVYGSMSSPSITESDPVQPTSAYGMAKAAAESAILGIASSAPTSAVVVRPFNHAGPGQRPQFVVASLAEQIRSLQDGDPIRVGSLEVIRDFTDVRDVVRAYRLIAMTGQAGATYNVASGVGVSVQDLADRMLRLASKRATLVTDASLVRADDPRQVIGNAEKLRRLGWVPEIALDRTLADVLATGRPQNG